MKLKIKKQFGLFGEERYKIIDDKLNANPIIKLNKKLKNIDNLIMEFSGGGIRGVMSAYTASVFEQYYDSIIRDKTKSIYGCSTGAIIASLWVLGLALKKSGKKNIWKFKDILKWYIEKGPIVFQENLFNGGLFGGMYNTKKLEKILKNNFKNYTFLKLYKKTRITLNIRTINVNENKPIILNHINTPNFEVWAAIRASMSAPIYFSNFTYNGITYADGGCGTYNCNLITAYEEAIKKINLNNFYLLSFGTGRKNIGKLGKSKLSHIKWYFNYSSEESNNNQEKKIKNIKGLNYTRWNIDLPDELVAMDKTDNINEMISLVDK